MLYRFLILLLALLATVQPSPAPVTVLPEETPAPKKKVKDAPSKKVENVSMAGTWVGKGNAKSNSDGSTATFDFTINVSADENTVRTSIDGIAFRKSSSAERHGGSLTWSLRQNAADDGTPGNWAGACTLHSNGRFVKNDIYINGPLKGATVKTIGTLTRQ